MRKVPLILAGVTAAASFFAIVPVGAAGASAGASWPNGPRDDGGQGASQSYGFEVRDLAEDRGISVEEAATRLRWQAAFSRLRDQLPRELGSAFAGFWVDPTDGDRLKLAYVQGTDDAVRGRGQRRLEEAGISRVTDVLTLSHSYTALQNIVDALRSDATEANRDSVAPIAISLKEVANRVELLVPPEGKWTPAQRAFIERERDSGRTTVVTEDLTFVDEACNTGGVLSCDPPLRGGTHWQTAVKVCTVGFYAKSRSDGAQFFLTAGHCSAGGVGAWGFNANGSRRDFGIVHNSRDDSSGDHPIVRVGSTGWNSRLWVAVLDRVDTNENFEYSILGDGQAGMSTRVCYTGAQSRNSDCGEVTDNNLVINGATFMRANYCGTTGGDSGSPIFSNSTAWGMHQGSYAECDKVFQPVRASENALNVDVVFGL